MNLERSLHKLAAVAKVLSMETCTAPGCNKSVSKPGYKLCYEYAARQKKKQELYQKYEFNLIELSDEHIKNLDDYLPKLLLKFGVAVS